MAHAISATLSRIDTARNEIRRRALLHLDSATPERTIKLPEDGVDIAPAGMQRVSEAPFDRMAIYKQITFRQHEAGERYRLNALIAEADPSPGSVDLDGSHAGFGPVPPSMFSAQAIASARDRHRKADAAIGPRLAKVLRMVLLEERPLSESGREVAGYRERKAAIVAAATLFRLALDVLADHYRLSDDTVVQIRRRRYAWMGPGARPIDMGLTDVDKPPSAPRPPMGRNVA